MLRMEIPDAEVAAYLIQSHPILDEQRDTGVEIADVPLEHEVTFRLRRDTTLEISQPLLRFADKHNLSRRTENGREKKLTSRQFILHLHILLSSHAEQMCHTVPVRVSIREAAGGHAARRGGLIIVN